MSAEGITSTVVKAIEKRRVRRHHHELRQRRHGRPLRQTRSSHQSCRKPWDAGLAKIFQTLKPLGGAWIITADHGNAETMIDPVTGGPHTYHTTNPVPFILVTGNDKLKLKSGGALRDIAPTLLGILGQNRRPRDDPALTCELWQSRSLVAVAS
jgi:2,3-bisphosphoglycerate-independent phosphoglycerate mutase